MTSKEECIKKGEYWILNGKVYTVAEAMFDYIPSNYEMNTFKKMYPYKSKITTEALERHLSVFKSNKEEESSAIVYKGLVYKTLYALATRYKLNYNKLFTRCVIGKEDLDVVINELLPAGMSVIEYKKVAATSNYILRYCDILVNVQQAALICGINDKAMYARIARHIRNHKDEPSIPSMICKDYIGEEHEFYFSFDTNDIDVFNEYIVYIEGVPTTATKIASRLGLNRFYVIVRLKRLGIMGKSYIPEFDDIRLINTERNGIGLLYKDELWSYNRLASTLGITTEMLKIRLDRGCSIDELFNNKTLCQNMVGKEQATYLYKGRRYSAKELADMVGMSPSNMRKRLRKLSIEEAVDGVPTNRAFKVVYEGNVYSMNALAKKLGVNKHQIKKQIESGKLQTIGGK